MLRTISQLLSSWTNGGLINSDIGLAGVGLAVMVVMAVAPESVKE